jgi:hypothetical protein
VGWPTSCETWAEKSNAWVWKVTLSFTSVPDFFMMPGSTASPITFEITSSVA